MRATSVLIALTALLVLASAAFAASIQCKPGPGDCNGTRAADVMSGTKGKDRMHGFQRGDEMTGRGGPDKLSGGPGADTITPGWGKDRVFAGRGNDTIDSRDGMRDRIICGKGNRDVVEADRVDKVGGTCEIKNIAK
jgi:hypothetical protein